MSVGKVDVWKAPGAWTNGINNVERSLALTERELQKGEDVDLDDLGKASRRKGKTLLLAGTYKWLWSDGVVCLGLHVSTGSLVSISSGFTGHTVLRTGLNQNRIVYSKVLDKVYYTNNQVIGYVQGGADHALPTPTEEFKEAMFPCEFLVYHAGRLWGGRANQLWPSDVLAVGQRDQRMAPKQFQGNLTLVESVRNGMFIADTGNTYYMAIKDPTEMIPDALQIVAFYGAIPHAVTRVDGSLIGGREPVKGTVLFWGSPNGVCVGADNGEFTNVSATRYTIPGTYSGSALYRKNHRGTSQVIMSLIQ